MAVRAVIVDYKCLRSRTEDERVSIRDLVSWLHERGLRVCVFSTDPIDAQQFCAGFGIPAIAATVTQAEVEGGKKRGSPAWIDTAQAKLGLESYEFVYVGSTALDWRTAINSGVMYFHAGWTAPQPPNTTSLVALTPQEFAKFLHFYFLPNPRWSFVLDDPGGATHLRCLLPASASLPRNGAGSPTFRLQDIFTYGSAVDIAGANARDLLLLHVIASCYVEGILGRNTYFCVYPSSKVGHVSSQIEEYVRPAASIVHGFYKDDLLVRETQGVDTSLARYNAKQRGADSGVTINNQTSTVKVGDKYRGKLTGRRVVVFDDFTTSGSSLEWAKVALRSAGADEVILVSMGKYGTRHDIYVPKQPIDPFRLNPELTRAAFDVATHGLQRAIENEQTMSALTMTWAQGEGG